jgi:hypothetical protein
MTLRLRLVCRFPGHDKTSAYHRESSLRLRLVCRVCGHDKTSACHRESSLRLRLMCRFSGHDKTSACYRGSHHSSWRDRHAYEIHARRVCVAGLRSAFIFAEGNIKWETSLFQITAVFPTALSQSNISFRSYNTPVFVFNVGTSSRATNQSVSLLIFMPWEFCLFICYMVNILKIHLLDGDSSHSMDTSGIKRPGPEADHSSPSSAEVKNGGAIPPFSHMSAWRSA